MAKHGHKGLPNILKPKMPPNILKPKTPSKGK